MRNQRHPITAALMMLMLVQMPVEAKQQKRQSNSVGSRAERSARQPDSIAVAQ